MWCVLGTLGSFLAASRSAFWRFLLSAAALLAWPRAEGTLWPVDMSSEPLSEREGFDDEYRLWWPRAKMGGETAVHVDVDVVVAAAAAALIDEEATCGPAATTRRTDGVSMA